MFEYVLLDGVNDTPEDARRLASLLGDIKAKVNLLPLNAAPGIPYERPSDERVSAFGKILADRGIWVSVQEEPRPRHPGGVRTADRRGTEEERRSETGRRSWRAPRADALGASASASAHADERLLPDVPSRQNAPSNLISLHARIARARSRAL